MWHEQYIKHMFIAGYSYVFLLVSTSILYVWQCTCNLLAQVIKQKNETMAFILHYPTRDPTRKEYTS